MTLSITTLRIIEKRLLAMEQAIMLSIILLSVSTLMSFGSM